ncbi:hypothetical protein ACTOV9_00690 [Legionella pneumophila]|uniref:hypothetical protein n=1 Tax=Legionella pneumophila TaxID=446 RepID=UPI000487FE11|nr:hypothetical protein [Legionella pneumophila]MDW9167075.1 hypothetical protein [Legionella pneumophila subsp. fraseri]MDX1845565.1 hypothetical protein [Legionella pneumophila subsp. fraseri]VEB32163.1 Uncharacterised protein [Legionella pneumophila]HAT1771516.1 hypothetical protein [Legionella pneumophila]HAT1940441.1 hypothetical protein [Legionella pneumophila]
MTTENQSIPYLFEFDSFDEIYMQIKNESALWHAPAKKHWQIQFEEYHQYLDADFLKEFQLHFFSRIWELTLISYISQQLGKNDGLIKNKVKNKRYPDFCFKIDNQKFYLEAHAPSSGLSIELNASFEDIAGKARNVPIASYKERLCSSIREKGDILYYGKDGKSAYKDQIGVDSGFVIAVSMAKIPFFNQPIDYYVDLSCILGLSPRKIPILRDKDGNHFIGSIYHDKELSFQKSGTASPITTNYFSDDTYGHISAILISHSSWSFFPDADQYGIPLHWEKCRNDYILVHNPFAKIPLPSEYLSVYREITSREVLSLQQSNKFSLSNQESA